MNPRKKLSDILSGGSTNLQSLFASTEPAKDFEPLPAGEYVARIENGELDASRTKGTPGYKLTFVIHEGDFVGRKFWHDLWLTPAAIAMTKRDLAKLGIDSLDRLEAPFPPGIIVKAKVVLRTEDDGTTHNKVRSFEVIRIEQPEADSFAPSDGEEPF